MQAVMVKMNDGSGREKQMKLGRLRPKAVVDAGDCTIVVTSDGRHKAVMKLDAFYDKAEDSNPPPASIDYATKSMPSIKRVYLNDQYGDCVIAGKYHAVGIWSGNDTPNVVLGTDQEVLNSYHTICGPGDNGCNITDVLDYFRNTGLKFGGVVHKIDGYVSIDWTNKLMVMVALDLFGGATIGINLPDAWTCTDCDWTTTNTRIVGGHDVRCIDYNERGVRIATWGGIVTILWDAFMSKKWIEEMYVELAKDWYNDDNLSPNGIDVQALKDALSKLGGGTVPPLGPPTPPPVVCPPGTHPDPTGKCIPDSPPPLPIPQHWAVDLPSIPVTVFGLHLGHTDPISVQGNLVTHRAKGAGITLPPWVVALLKQVCASPIAMKPPWSWILGLLCSQLPAKMSAQSVNIVLPPWVLMFLRLACKGVDFLADSPVKTLIVALCSLLPQQHHGESGGDNGSDKPPCGCHQA